MARREPAINHVWQLKVTLQESSPAIWRRFLVPGGATLKRLHVVLQTVMGWKNSHMHLFKVGKTTYGQLNAEMDVKDEEKALLGRIAPEAGAHFIYEYDLGDGWTHDIVVEDILPTGEGMSYPVCLDGKRACPPEDCGGIGGYDNLLEILRDPDHEEFQSTLEWLGRPLDPETFDTEAVNRILVPWLPSRPH